VSILAGAPGRLQNRPVFGTALELPAIVVAPAPAPLRAGSDWPLARFERSLVRGGAFLLPLAVWWSTYDQFVLPKLLLARAVLVGMAVLFVARAIWTGRLTVRRTPLDLPILAFLGSAVVSTILAVNLNVAVFGIYSRYDGLLTLATYAGLFWFTVQTLHRADDARALTRTMLAGGYVVAAIAIVQWAGDSAAGEAQVHAYGTLGQWNILGAFLAMLWPLAFVELVEARSAGARLIAANVLIVLVVALALTFSRSAWLGSAAGLAVIVFTAGPRGRPASFVLLMVAITASGVIAISAAAGVELARSLVFRVLTIVDPSDPRGGIWRDTLSLIASRPLAGFGPDTFGLVFPKFNTIEYVQPIDKAHAEILQIAATQGLLGVAAYAWILYATVRAFWRCRASPLAAAIFAGWAGYQLTLQLNFTALASAFPFWMFMAAAMVSWDATSTRSVALGSRRWRAAAGVAVGAAGCALVVAGMILPYLADAALLEAVNADFSGRSALAAPVAARAMGLGPRESVYAVEVGNIAFERGDWAGARAAYTKAVDLGTYNAAVYRNLAIADRNLGFLADARIAAEGAYYLNPFDPANRALLAQFGGPGA
jgi:O-antigen ligase